jgi:hypothetical protein
MAFRNLFGWATAREASMKAMHALPAISAQRSSILA